MCSLLWYMYPSKMMWFALFSRSLCDWLFSAVRCVLSVVSCSVCTACSQLFSAYCLFSAVQCVLPVLSCSVHTACSQLFSAYSLFSAVQCILPVLSYSVHTPCSQLFTAYSLFSAVQCTLHVLSCSVHTACSQLFSVAGFTDIALSLLSEYLKQDRASQAAPDPLSPTSASPEDVMVKVLTLITSYIGSP